MSRTAILRYGFALIAIAFFATPLALRAVGVTADAFENRPFAAAPKLSQGWDVFDQTTRFLTDRMPLRELAVRANTKISEGVFGTEPRYLAAGGPGGGALPFAGAGGTGGQPGGPPPAAPLDQVTPGEDGWLYLQGEFDRACKPPIPFDAATRRWRALVAVVRASGRRAVTLVAPDKASVHPEHLSPSTPSLDCANTGKDELWGQVATGTGGVVGLRDRLLALKSRTGEDLYLHKDSHWNPIGALELVREALAQVGRGVRIAPGDVRNAGSGRYFGDLTALRGKPEADSQPLRTLRRRPGAPTVPGRTVFVYDSYGEAPLVYLPAFFADLRAVKWVGTPTGRIVDEIAAADTVIFETVEREYAERTSDIGVASPTFLGALRERLGTR